MNHRRDIDGLRALAVLPVVLFHAGFNVFSGGFVGVDVFFVISGYLITQIISNEISAGQFTIWRFYERRIRRIFPALFAVLFFSLIVGLVILLPSDLEAFARSLAAATLFSSNILFWRQSGYFEPDAEINPLLHTWSLAVEEQFYIFFPIFLILAWRWGRHWKSTTWICLLASLALSIYGVRHHDEATFYLLPTRAWELLVGSVIALQALPALKNQTWREMLAAIGIALIVYAVLAYDRTMLFPGEAAMLPCLGAALIIYAGLDGSPTYTARLLGLRPFAFIGLISYSLYLWHWPLIVYAKYYNIDTLTTLQATAVVAASVALATLSWRYIEAPFRKGNTTYFTRNRAHIFLTSGAVMSSVILASGTIIVTQGLPIRINPQSVAIIVNAEHGQNAIRQCMDSRKNSDFRKPDAACVFGEKNRQPDFLLWGDSQANSLLPGLVKAMEGTKHSLKALMMTGCPPIMDISLSYSSDYNCKNFNAQALQYAKTGPEKTVILFGRWAATVHGAHMDGNLIHSPPSITPTPKQIITRDEARTLLTKNLSKTIDAITTNGKTVVLVYPVPESSHDIPRLLARTYQHQGPEAVGALNIARASYSSRTDDVNAIFDQIAKSKNVVHINPADLLCAKGDCIIYQNGRPLYFDSSHLSAAGADYIAPLFKPIFEKADHIPDPK